MLLNVTVTCAPAGAVIVDMLNARFWAVRGIVTAPGEVVAVVAVVVGKVVGTVVAEVAVVGSAAVTVVVGPDIVIVVEGATVVPVIPGRRVVNVGLGINVVIAVVVTGVAAPVGG